MVKILLTPEEEKIAIEVAEMRFLEQRKAGRPLDHILPTNTPADVIGAMGELAVAKHFGFKWDGAFFVDKDWLDWRKTGSDVGPFEVRTTVHKNGRLIVQKKDKNEKPFILVTAHRRPEFWLMGWCFGEWGKQEKWWKDVGYGFPCYYVPQTHLRTMTELEEIVESALAKDFKFK